MKVKYFGELINSNVILKKKKNPYWRVLLAEGFGEEKNDCIILSPVEALWLCDRGQLIVEKDNKKLSYDALVRYFLSKDPQLWSKYFTYHVLRNAGYVAKPIQGVFSFLLYKKGENPQSSKPFAKIIVFESLREVDINLLETALSQKGDSEVIVAVVDEHGDVVFYRVEEVLRGEAMLKIRKS